MQLYYLKKNDATFWYNLSTACQSSNKTININDLLWYKGRVGGGRGRFHASQEQTYSTTWYWPGTYYE